VPNDGVDHGRPRHAVRGWLVAAIVVGVVLLDQLTKTWAVRDLADGFVTEAVSTTDGIVEAVRRPGERFVAGVQWHPEFTPLGDTEQIAAAPVIDDFLAAAALAATGVHVA